MDMKEIRKNFFFELAAVVTFISTYYIMMPAISMHMLDLGIDNSTIALVVGLFSISSLISRPIGGKWVDSYGTKKVMYISIALFFLTPFLLKLPQVVLGVGLSQLIYGFTVGTFTVATTTLVSEIATPETMAQFLGINSIAFVVAKGMAPAIGVRVINATNFNGVIVATIVAAAFGLVFSILLKDVKITKEPGETGNFFEVLKSKYVFLPTLVLFLGMITFGAISSMLPVFAESRNIENIEYFFVINTSVVVATRLLIGKTGNRYMEPLTAIGMVAMTLSFICMAFVQNFAHLVVVAIIYGVGFALLFPMLTSLLVLHIRGVSKSMALGIFTAAFDLGVAGGSMLMGLSKYINFNLLYLLLAILPFCGLLIYQWVYRPIIAVPKISSQQS